MALQDIHAFLGTITLTDQDLNGSVVLDKVSHLRTLIVALGSDTIAIHWLSEEHYRGAALYAAAKVNKGKWGSQTATGEPLSRATIIERFNSWAREVQSRLDQYKSAPVAATTAPWLIRLSAFRTDPVNNLG